jgi:hypothetical protein
MIIPIKRQKKEDIFTLRLLVLLAGPQKGKSKGKCM